MLRRCLPILIVIACPLVFADEQDRLKVGVQPDGRIVVPTNQIIKPAGRQILFPGRPVDLAFDQDGKVLVVKNMRSLVFIDVASERVFQKLSLPEGGDPRPGFSVCGLVVHKNRIYASDAQDLVRVAVRKADGSYEWARQHIELTKPKVGKLVHPSGMALIGDDKLWVCSTRGNNVQLVDLKTGRVDSVVDVGVAPYMPVVVGNRVFVSNWGGDPPKEGESQAKTSDTPIKVDERTGIANEGTISVVEEVNGIWKQTKTIKVGLHPSGMTLDSKEDVLYVANANSDSISVIRTTSNAVAYHIPCRPESRLPFGSGTNAVVRHGKFLIAANGTNNCLQVFRHEEPVPDIRLTQPLGLIPTGWYPGAILVSPDGKKLYVANIKGHGSLSQPRPDHKGKNCHDHLGSVSVIDEFDTAQFAKYTEEVNANNRLAYSLAGLEKPRADAKPQPVPERHGEPSVFKHVIYVIKENRTYDQVFGDMKEGNGDPNLVLFGEEVTPNHHALARQFTLFDNFYCSGVLSADGHNWCNEAYVTDYLERSFGGWTRSYPDDGSDPLAMPATGHLWDNAIAHKKTLRNFGENVKNEFPKGKTWTDWYTDYKSGDFKLKVTAKAHLKPLEPHTHTGFPWFPLLMPDVYKAKLFIDELKAWEQKGDMPNLVYVALPADHTTGTRQGYPTPRAQVADNDLALGHLVEAVSKSKFWKETCIFVVEDDPQNGFDHVDAHRTVALVISPYTKRKFVDSTNYNQTGMVKTIELILGLPPMNQMDLSATAMRSCFQATSDFASYTAVPNKIPLDEMNKPLSQLSGKALYWAKKSHELDLDDGDEADEDTLNRILWHATRGYETPYPERFAGRKEE
jgi:YVTN family beta-propeller protein